MATDLDLALGQLHRRILGAIGFTPVLVGLSLAGCATEPDGALDRARPSQPERPTGGTGAAEVVPQRQAGAVVARPHAANSVEPAYEPVIEVLGILTPGHVVEVLVHEVPPGADVTLFIGEPGSDDGVGLSLVRPELLGEAFADSDGTASLRFLVPFGTDVGLQQIQAVADDTERQHYGLPVEVEVVAVAATMPNLRELHPLFLDEDLAAGGRYRACIPVAEYGVCPAIVGFHPWQSLEIVAYALDRPLSPDLSALACLPEVAFEGDCCYMVELWDVIDGSVADACIPPTPDPPPPPAGGGGGWGGGYLGRPFGVGGDRARTADVHRGDGWCAEVGTGAPDPRIVDRVVRAWTASAQAEHASVASFGRFVLELLGLGAPADLVARATRAQADEIRHARDAFGVATALSGAPVAPGPLSIDGALGRSPREILVSAILEGCVGETVSALQVQEAGRRAADPAISRVLSTTAEDELRHAELSWAFVRWMLAAHPELQDVARETFASVRMDLAPAADPDAAALATWGVLSDLDLHVVAEGVVARVVAPAAAALLGVSSREVEILSSGRPPAVVESC